jgi:hypothetical protein
MKQWTENELAMVRSRISTYMENDIPPESFETSIMLAAPSASARDVCALLDSKFAKKRYRPGGVHGPRRWNWFLAVIRNEAHAYGYLAQPPAVPRPEHGATPEEVNRGMHRTRF